MSYGNNLTEFNLKHGIHLITAPNGSGKSTITEALTYNLYGKPYRDIKLDELINRLNKKDLYTESNFDIGSDNFTIIRTMKPNTLKIIKNGNPLSLLSSKKLDQEEIDKILGLSYKMFKQIISLGVTYNKPYFTMSAQEKRETIESIFNIKIFGQMEQITKKKITAIKTEISINDSTLKVMENNISTQRNQIKNLKKMKESFFLDKENDIKRLQMIIDNNVKEIKEITTNLSIIQTENELLKNSCLEYEQLINKKDELYRNLSEIENKKSIFKNNTQNLEIILEKLVNENATLLSEKESIEVLKNELNQYKYEEIDKYNSKNELLISEISNLNSTISQINKEIDFLKNDKCPTCRRDFTSEYKESQLKSFTDKIKEIDILLNEKALKREDLQRKVKEQKIINEKINELKTDIKIKSESLKRISLSIDKYVIEQGNVEKELNKIDIETTLKEQTIIKEELNGLIEKLQELENVNKKKNEKEIKLNEYKVRLGYLDKEYNDSLIKIEEIKNKEFEMDVCEIEKQFENECEKFSNLYAENEKLNTSLTNYKIVVELLSKDGIKSFFLKKLIPILNQTVNNYLQKFELPIRLEFNERMDDKIYGLGGFGEELNYFSHSSGEQTKINLSVAFGFIETCKCISNWNSSLLCIDEILDSNVDSIALEKILDSLKNMVDSTKESSIYIISHKANEMKNLFNSIIEIERQNGFSKIKEN